MKQHPTAPVAQTSKSAVSRVSKPAGCWSRTTRSDSARAADLEIGDTAGLETCATSPTRGPHQARWLCAALLALGCLVQAQEKVPPAAAVSSIKGVKEEATAKVKPIEPTVTPPPKNAAQGVNKIDGIDTISGVKADGRTPVLPPPPVQTPPPPPPPKAPPVVGVKGTAVNVGGGTVGAGGSIRAVNGVAGINAAKLQNLETALQIKDSPTPQGPGKAKAAAELLGPGVGPKAGTKKDGRDVFQEFEKLPNKGS